MTGEEAPGQPGFQWEPDRPSGGDLVPHEGSYSSESTAPKSGRQKAAARQFDWSSLRDWSVLRTIPADVAVIVGGFGVFLAGFFTWYAYDMDPVCGPEPSNACADRWYGIASAFDRGFSRFAVILFLIIAVVYLLDRLPLLRSLIPDGYLDLCCGAAIVVADLFYLASLIRIPEDIVRAAALWIALIPVALANVGIALRARSSDALTELAALGKSRAPNAPHRTVRTRSSTPPPRTYAQADQTAQSNNTADASGPPASQSPPTANE